MLGQGQPFTEVPWFWSDQYATNLQLAGDPVAADGVVIRGDLDDLRFAAFYLQGERLVAALGVNSPRDVRAATDFIAREAPVDREILADPTADLRRLAKRALA
jgi:3-phenylpropionate/trans-cinnamate dioxygenase ferredoxin reductase subunit